jgi:hypothetical protein
MQQVVELCAYVESQNFSKVTEIIRDHVEKTSGQSPGDYYHDAQINDLASWLSTFKCIKNVKSLPGILKSNPPHKIIVITFEMDGTVIEKNLKLLLDKDLEVLHID